MEIDDFSYFRCINCKDIKIFPIPHKSNGYILSCMCVKYDSLKECCNKPNVLHGTVKYGIEEEYIKITDLPLALRKEFPPEVTHKFECGKHSLIVTKCNGDKVIISINGNDILIDDGNLPFVYEVMDD